MQHLLLLHGAMGAKEQFKNIAAALKNEFIVHTLNFSGHGGIPIAYENFSIPFFAAEVMNYLDNNNLDKVSLFGYSMGGYVAMYVALNYQERISSVITLAAKFHWDKSTAEKEIKMMDAETIASKLPNFATQLQARHAPLDWKLLLRKCADMLHDLGEENTLKLEDYANVKTKSLLLIGDRDKMVTIDETIAVYKQLPDAAMGLLPSTPHPVEQVNEQVLLVMMKQFLRRSEVQ
ncbi:MAG TPA: alpha/beta fold hydrolase [Panacibacter sp.]|nr:alpha/beta fold hydrolase [Panacibacter sp.]HNP42973.1 alpha/beta fold hydrolase [Panacibacter sp.]